MEGEAKGRQNAIERRLLLEQEAEEEAGTRFLAENRVEGDKDERDLHPRCHTHSAQFVKPLRRREQKATRIIFEQFIKQRKLRDIARRRLTVLTDKMSQ